MGILKIPRIPWFLEAKSHIVAQTPMTLGTQALRELNSSQTSTERGVQRWEQANSLWSDSRGKAAMQCYTPVYLVYRMQDCCVKIWVFSNHNSGSWNPAQAHGLFKLSIFPKGSKRPTDSGRHISFQPWMSSTNTSDPVVHEFSAHWPWPQGLGVMIMWIRRITQ